MEELQNDESLPAGRDCPTGDPWSDATDDAKRSGGWYQKQKRSVNRNDLNLKL